YWPYKPMDVVSEGDRIAKHVSFSTSCHLLDKLRGLKVAKAKKAVLARFILLWETQYFGLPGADTRAGAGRASFYPLLRLMLPQFDRARPAYGLRETALSRLYIKAFGIASTGSVAQSLMHPTGQSTNLTRNADFADLLFDVVRNRCREDNVLNLKDVNELLDRLAGAQSADERLSTMQNFMRSATALEHKWLVRLVVRRESGCGMTAANVLHCLHPAAPDLWDVTQDLILLCQRIADLDPKVSPSLSSANQDGATVSLFVPFRPMLCERSDSPDLLCASALALCTLGGTVPTELGLMLETKYDGERVQVHKSGTSYRYWSRNCLEWTASYGANGDQDIGSLTPRLHKAFAPHVQSCIIDGEMMAYSTWTDVIMPKTTGFDVKRSQLDSDLLRDPSLSAEDAENYQPCLIVFDLLYLNGEVITNKTVVERKRLLAQVFGLEPTANSCVSERPLASANDGSQTPPVLCPPPLSVIDGTVYLSGWCQVPIMADHVAKVFDHLMDYRQEGLVAKLTVGRSPYLPGRRQRGGWWKLKPDYVSGLLEDLDCLVVGGYFSSASGSKHLNQSKRVRQFLCAVRGSDNLSQQDGLSLPCFLSFCRVSSGLTVKQFKELNHKLGPHWKPFDRKRPNTGFTEWLKVTTERPDVWIAPQHSVTLQLHASELISSGSYATGLTARFPRVVAVRDDKPWQDCLTMEELVRLNTETQGKLAVRRLAKQEGRDYPLSDNDATDRSPVEPSSPSNWNDPTLLEDELSLSSDTHNTSTSDEKSYGNLYVGTKPSSTPRATSTPVKKRRLPVSSFLPSVNFMENHEFCLLFSAEMSSEDKEELEQEIKAAGGTVVQNPRSSTFCIIADKLTAKTRNILAACSTSPGGKRPRDNSANMYNIVSVSWLESCLEAGKLLPWRPNHLLVMKPETAESMNAEFDSYGDSFTEPLTVDGLKELLSRVVEGDGDDFGRRQGIAAT
ncbi:DNA ligase 4, partial [Clonorchis sinensis]